MERNCNTLQAIVSGSKATQRSRILNHLMEHGSVTARELWEDYGIGSPRKRISELRKSPQLEAKGLEITSTRESGHNRFGEPTSFNRYTLRRADHEKS